MDGGELLISLIGLRRRTAVLIDHAVHRREDRSRGTLKESIFLGAIVKKEIGDPH